MGVQATNHVPHVSTQSVLCPEEIPSPTGPVLWEGGQNGYIR